MVGLTTDNYIGDIGPVLPGVYCIFCAHLVEEHVTASGNTWAAILDAMPAQGTRVFRIAGDAMVPADTAFWSMPQSVLTRLLDTSAAPTPEDIERHLRDHPVPQLSPDRLSHALREVDPQRVFMALAAMSSPAIHQVLGIVAAYLQTEGMQIVSDLLGRYYVERASGYATGVVTPGSKQVDKSWAFKVVHSAVTAQLHLLRRSPIPQSMSLLTLLTKRIDFGTPYARTSLDIRAFCIQAAFWNLQALRGGVARTLNSHWVEAVFKELDAYHKHHVDAGNNRTLWDAVTRSTTSFASPAAAAPAADTPSPATAVSPSPATARPAPKPTEVCQVEGCANPRDNPDRAWCSDHVTRTQRRGVALKRSAKDELERIAKRAKRAPGGGGGRG